jgi:hypothetical protein
LQLAGLHLSSATQQAALQRAEAEGKRLQSERAASIAREAKLHATILKQRKEIDELKAQVQGLKAVQGASKPGNQARQSRDAAAGNAQHVSFDGLSLLALGAAAGAKVHGSGRLSTPVTQWSPPSQCVVMGNIDVPSGADPRVVATDCLLILGVISSAQAEEYPSSVFRMMPGHSASLSDQEWKVSFLAESTARQVLSRFQAMPEGSRQGVTMRACEPPKMQPQSHAPPMFNSRVQNARQQLAPEAAASASFIPQQQQSRNQRRKNNRKRSRGDRGESPPAAAYVQVKQEKKQREWREEPATAAAGAQTMQQMEQRQQQMQRQLQQIQMQQQAQPAAASGPVYVPVPMMQQQSAAASFMQPAEPPRWNPHPLQSYMGAGMGFAPQLNSFPSPAQPFGPPMQQQPPFQSFGPSPFPFQSPYGARQF